MKLIFLLLFCLFNFVLNAQSHIPKDYFTYPLEVPIVLSGTFGELRSNHFHSGLDIKTQQREGLKVLATAPGYVSRIKIQHYGYGKALYVQHPNGYTTVYAHLQKFSPEIEAYVKARQYTKESYEIELFPEAGELEVNQGAFLAFSGNTGGSGGPHLHYEIRNGQQHPMNPKLFGMEIQDSRPPIISSLFVYPLDKDAHVNNSAQRQKVRLIPLQDGSYTTENLQACGNIGFGISTVDQQDMAPNQNGVYSIEASLNGDKIFNLNFEKFSFAESRYLNRLIDYEYFINNRSRVQKLFLEPNNPLSLYSNVISDGKINVQNNLTYQYNIQVTDFNGNERLIRIPIQGQRSENIRPKELKKTGYFAQANQAFSVEENGIDVYIPKGSLYDDTYLDIQFKGDTIKFHKEDTPIHQNITLGFDVSKYRSEDRDQLFIARLGYKGRPIYSSTYKKGTRFTTGVRTFGDYTVVADINPPRISPVNFKDGQWISGNKDLRLKISDDLSGIKSYRATVNGKFILMEYEYKKNLLTHDFDDGIVNETENNLKLIVTDNVGNSKTYEAKFFRKQ